MLESVKKWGVKTQNAFVKIHLKYAKSTTKRHSKAEKFCKITIKRGFECCGL